MYDAVDQVVIGDGRDVVLVVRAARVVIEPANRATIEGDEGDDMRTLLHNRAGESTAFHDKAPRLPYLCFQMCGVQC